MQISVDTNSHEPAFAQIAKQIKRLILSGGLKPGDDLPSVRAIAANAAVNPMTVSKAFQRLADEGVLARRRGKSMTVAERPPSPTPTEGVIEAALRVVFTQALDDAFKLEIPAGTITEVFLRLVDERNVSVKPC